MELIDLPPAKNGLAHHELTLPDRSWRKRGDRSLAVIMEALILAVACLSAWPLGTDAQFLVPMGLPVLLVLWAGRLLLEGKVTWQKCPITLCLACLFLAGIWQVISLPQGFLEIVSPATAEVYE